MKKKTSKNRLGLDVPKSTAGGGGRLLRFDAQRALTTERMSEYGPPGESFARMAALKALVATCPHPGVRHALEMICVKMARLCADPAHEDSSIDIAGYARTIPMLLDEESRYGEEEEN